MSSYIGEIRIGKDYQATLPSYLGPYPTSTENDLLNSVQPLEDDPNIANDPENLLAQEHGAVMVWDPKSITDENLIMFLRAARSVTAFAGMCRKKGPNKEDGASVVSRDDTTQRYFDILHENEYDVNQTLDILGKEPLPKMWEKEWTHEEAKCFSRAIKIIGKEFHRVREEYLKHKRTKDLIQFYYFWKKSPYNPSRNQRRNRRNRKNTNPIPGSSNNNQHSKSGSNSKSNSTRLPNPSVLDQVKTEDGSVSSNKPSENSNAEPSLPPNTIGASSPGRLNGQLNDLAKSSAPPTTTEVDDNLFDNDDIPLLNLVKVARGLAIPAPNTNTLGPDTFKDKACSLDPKDPLPKEILENTLGQTEPAIIKMADLSTGEAGVSIDPILPEAIVLDEGIAAPRISIATTAPSCNLAANNNNLYEIPLSDIGTIKSEIIPVLSDLETKHDGPEKTNDDPPISLASLNIVISTSEYSSATTVKCPPSSPVPNRTSTPEPFVPVRSSVLVPTPPALIKNLKPDLKRVDHTPPPPERSPFFSPENSESELATTNAHPETDQWLGEKLFRNGNMYRYIKRVDGSSCARTDLAFVYQKLPFHNPLDLESSRDNNNHLVQSSSIETISNITITTSTNTATVFTTTTSITSLPFATAGKINSGNSHSKGPPAIASILPIPSCPPKSRSPITHTAANKFMLSHHQNENDRLGLVGGTFPPHPPSGPPFWYPLTPAPPLHLAQASVAALLPYFMAAAAGGAFAPPFPLAPPSYEPPPEAALKHKNQHRPQESGQDFTRSSAGKNGYNPSSKTSSPSPNPFPFESCSPYYPYFPGQLQQRAPNKANAMGLVKGVPSPPQNSYPPPPRPSTHKFTPKGPAPFTPWASRPTPHTGIYEYPPPSVGVKRKNAQDCTLERKKTPALDAKSNASSRTKQNFAKFPGPYNELPYNHHHSLGIGSNQDSPAHHPNPSNVGGGPGKTPPRTKISATSTLGAPTTTPLPPMPADPFYHHRHQQQQHFQSGPPRPQPPVGPFEFNPFFAGPNSVSNTNPHHPYHLSSSSHQNFHPGLMRSYHRGANFNNPFPPIPEEIMAAAAAQHQYQLLQQHPYFSNPFAPNILPPSVLQQQDRNDLKRE